MKIRSTCISQVIVLTIMLLIPNYATVSSADEWIGSDDNAELVKSELTEDRVLVIPSNEAIIVRPYCRITIMSQMDIREGPCCGKNQIL